MLVFVHVSSINTSRAGSNMPCSRIQRRRARATSARFCSAAYNVFFKAEVVSFVEPPHGGTTAQDSCFRHRRNDFVQRPIWLFGDQTKQKFGVLLQRRYTATTWFRCNTSCRLPALRPNHHHARADPIEFSRLAPRCPCFDRFNDPFTQVPRIRLRHCFPPKSNQCRQTRSLTTPWESFLIQTER